MKTTLKAIVFIVAGFSFFAFLPADNCGMYAPVKEGTELEMKHFSDNDKLTGTNRTKVLSVKNNSAGQTVEMKSESYDKKDKLTGTSNYELKCENGVFYIDMRTMVSQEQTSAYKNMKVTIEADQLDIPWNPKAGQDLKNGSVNMTAVSEGNMLTLNFSMLVTNRKVAAIEDVTVPAGTFKCVKITYDAEIKSIFSIKIKAAEWFAKEVGLVRSESYNNNGKLQGYSVLSSIK